MGTAVPKEDLPGGGAIVPEDDLPGGASALEKEVVNENYRIPGTDTRIPGTSGLNQFLISTGRGVIDLWAGGKQVLGMDTSEQPNELEEFGKVAKESPVIATAGRIVGQVAPTLAVPGGAVVRGAHAASKLPMLGILAKTGIGTEAAALGGLQGFLNYVPEGESRGVNTAVSALTAGAVTKGLEVGGRVFGPSVRRGVDWIRGQADDAVGRVDLGTMAGTRAATSSDDLARALSKEGIDWQSLSLEIRDGVKAMADDAAKSGAPLTPAQLARVVRAENLPGGPARLTKGQMTGDRSQLRTEFDLRRTTAGKTLDDQLIAQDEALANSLDVIKLKTGGTTVAGREAEAGQKITKPLLGQLRKAQDKVTQLYKVADEAGETLTEVDASPLADFLIQNRAASISVPELRTIAAKLKDMGVASGDDLTKVPGAAAWLERQPNIRELEELRKLGVKLGRGNEAAGHWMGELNRVIDSMTEGKGGELYKAARSARIDMRRQFEDPGIIHRLVSEKPGGDRVTAFEDVFRKSVINSSVDDLTTLRKQLLLGGDGTNVQAEGVQAFKDLRAATLDYIKMGAMGNAKDEFSYAGLRRAVDSIGREKLEVLFGKNVANDITSVVESAKDMKAVFNKSGVYNPGTASALVEWLDRISGIVGLGKAGTYGRIYASGAAKKVVENLQQPKLVEQAAKPVEAAMSAGRAAQDDVYRQLLGLYAGRMGAKMAPGAGAAVSMPDEDE